MNETRRPKVRGIGGIFFKTRDPAATRDWYRNYLGLNTDEYGTNFGWRQLDDPGKRGFSQWSPFADETYADIATAITK